MNRAVRDAVNLTTLFRWCGRFSGSIVFSRDAEGRGTRNRRHWRIMVLRAPTSEATRGVVFNESHVDISDLAHRAAGAIRRTPEWNRADRAREARARRADAKKVAAEDDEGRVEPELVEYDWDIWKSPLEEGKPVLNSKGTPVKPPVNEVRRSRHHGVLVEDIDAHKRGDYGGVDG